jgi:hypothetical protein
MEWTVDAAMMTVFVMVNVVLYGDVMGIVHMIILAMVDVNCDGIDGDW